MNKQEQAAQDRYDEGLNELSDLLGEWTKDYGDDDEGFENRTEPLSIDSKIVTTIWLSLGGPSSWIEYDHATGQAQYFTTRPQYATTHEPAVCITLGREETEEMVAFLDLEEVTAINLENGRLEI